MLLLVGWIVGTDLLEVPMPNIVKEAPDNIWITLYHVLRRPEVPRAKSWELLEIVHDFGEVGLDLRAVSFRWVPVDSLYDFVSAVQAIDQIGEDDSRSTVLREVPQEAVLLLLRHRLEQPHIIRQPVQYLRLQLPIYLCDLRRGRLQRVVVLLETSVVECTLSARNSRWPDVKSLHLAHDVVEALLALRSREAGEVSLILRNLKVLLLLHDLLIVVLWLARRPRRLVQIIHCGQSLITWLLIWFLYWHRLLLIVGIGVPAHPSDPKSSLRNALRVELFVVDGKVDGLSWAMFSSMMALSRWPWLLDRKIDALDESGHELCRIIPRILWYFRRLLARVRHREPGLLYHQLISGTRVLRPAVALPDHVGVVHILQELPLDAVASMLVLEWPVHAVLPRHESLGRILSVAIGASASHR